MTVASDPVKLGDLKGLRAKMTPGPWLPGEDDRHIGGDADHEDGPVHIVTLEEESMTADRDGIVATHNAADVLWEIVDSELAIAEAKKTADEAFRALLRAYSPGGRRMVTAEEEARLIGSLAACDLAVPHEEARHAAALAKVIR